MGKKGGGVGVGVGVTDGLMVSANLTVELLDRSCDVFLVNIKIHVCLRD